MRVDLDLKGMDETLDMLQRMPSEVVAKRGGPVKAALRKGARVIQQEAAINLHRIVGSDTLSDEDRESTGLLEKNLIVSRGKAPVGGNGERYLVRVKRRNYARESKESVTTLKTAQLLEYGAPGNNQRARPWLRPAFEARARHAIDVVTKDLAAAVDRIARKLLHAAAKG